MSLRTWEKEFYSKTADQAAGQYSSDVKLVEHSLKKWEGLKSSNLKRHKCRVDTFLGVVDSDREARLVVGSESCALCVAYLNVATNCEDCPLAKVRKGVRCDKAMESESRSPWTVFVDDRNPKPMLRWLKKALKMVQKK